MPICGARYTHRPGFCRHHAMKGRRRCFLHGGRLNRHSHPAWLALTRAPWGEAQWKGRARAQAIMRALGLPWYGGAPKRKATLTMADKAIAIANDVLEMLPAPRDVPDEQKGSAELLGEGVRSGLLLARDTVELGRSLLVVDGQRLTSVADMHPQDLKLLGMSQITALGLVKLGLKAADTGARNDIIGKLIAAIEAEKAGGKP